MDRERALAPAGSAPAGTGVTACHPALAQP